MEKIYRPGPIGGLADEYEKVLVEFKNVVGAISNDRFVAADMTLEADFQSIRNIVSHVVNSGYSYANYIRRRFNNEWVKTEVYFENTSDAIAAIDKMFAYTLATFEDKYHLSDDDLMNTIIKTSWTTYDLEAIIEHAIVHILRHRRQIQKRLSS
jgi:uncharacterized damage-inducible protein DinB